MKIGHNSLNEKNLTEVVAAVESCNDKIAEINEEKKDIYASAKADGFEISVIKALITERQKERKDPEKYLEHLTLMELYRQALRRTGRDDEKEEQV